MSICGFWWSTDELCNLWRERQNQIWQERAHWMQLLKMRPEITMFCDSSRDPCAQQPKWSTVGYSRAEALLRLGFDLVVDVLDLGADGRLVVPVQVVQPDHEGEEDQQEGHHELHHVLQYKQGRYVSDVRTGCADEPWRTGRSVLRKDTDQESVWFVGAEPPVSNDNLCLLAIYPWEENQVEQTSAEPNVPDTMCNKVPNAGEGQGIHTKSEGSRCSSLGCFVYGIHGSRANSWTLVQHCIRFWKTLVVSALLQGVGWETLCYIGSSTFLISVLELQRRPSQLCLWPQWTAGQTNFYVLKFFLFFLIFFSCCLMRWW